MKITIFGTGYVGLVTGTCLAEVGHEVMCVDIDQKKIDNLEQGIIPIYEPGLEELVIRNFKEARLLFTTDAKKGVDFGTAIFSAVGTPPDKNHRADLQYVKKVAETVGKYMQEYKVFINKSTVPVGTGEICKEIIETEIQKQKTSNTPSGHPEISCDIVSNPEFLKEGVAVRDFMLPDRIVCGLDSDKAKEMMSEIYKPFTRTNRPLFFTDIRSAEIIKYAANSFLATKISFINEIANFSELAGANISDISKGIGLDERIGSRFLHAGIGYGGSCFPKDVQALIETGKDFGYNFEIIQSVENVNQKQKLLAVEKLVGHVSDLHGKTITLWGLSFKPKTDDMRDAPSLSIIKKLLEGGVNKIQTYDPVSSQHALFFLEQSLGKGTFETQVSFHSDNYESLTGSDALILVTEWDMFRMVNFRKMKDLMKGNIIIDGRNIWNKTEVEKYGFVYDGIGK